VFSVLKEVLLNSASELLTGLPPIIDSGVETLILGSFPSPASLAAGQYYAHRQNQFWRLLATLTGEPLTELAYPLRCRRLLEHGIGIWDVYGSCQRQGALDAAIRVAAINDFNRLKEEAPRLRRVFFNGQTAGGMAERFSAAGYAISVLPSTSPAYTLAFERKLAIWRAALLD
jgi:TDG/mug DNA glycosylase family protein